jgi:LysR family transcriptional regulator, glycine cleavage system transcriptional activator
MADNLPPMNTLRIFDAVVRHMSFTRAAAELGMSQAAVSYQIKLLEDRIGAALFQRLTRKLAMTDAGRRLAPVVADVFARLRDTFTSFSSKNDGILAISSVITFTTNWLVPRIGKFQMAWPEIAVRLETDSRLVDFAREEFDIGIRGGRVAKGIWPGLASDLLLSVDLMPVCAPEILARFGPVSSPTDLVKMPLIGEFNPDRPHPNGVEADWRSWFHAAGAPTIEIPPLKSRFATQQLEAAAALTGQGVALLTPEFFRPEIDSGRLIPLSPVRVKDVESYYLVCLASRREVPKIKAFREWIQQELTIGQGHSPSGTA